VDLHSLDKTLDRTASFAGNFDKIVHSTSLGKGEENIRVSFLKIKIMNMHLVLKILSTLKVN
jgi:hypothetical protein